MEVDSIAKEIVKILIHVWGNGYTIVDRPIYKKIGKPGFHLIWRTDSCSVIFGFIPNELYMELSNVYKVVPYGYSLGIYSDVNTFSDRKKSEIHTRESLGLE